MSHRHPTPDARTGVLFLHSATMPPLGADTWVHAQIAGGLDRSRHRVHVACVGSAGAPTPTYAAMRGIPEMHIVEVDLGRERYASTHLGVVGVATESRSAVASITRLARHVRHQRVAIIHTSDRPRDAAAAVALSRLTGARSIVHCHVGYDPRWMGRLLRWAIARADARIAVSEFVASTLVDHGHDPATTYVVLNAIDPDLWTPGLDRASARADLDLPPSAPVVITVCRLFPSKGPAELISAIARVSRDHPDVHLLVVGNDMSDDGSFTLELQDLIHRVGLDGRVSLLGRRQDVARLMAAADVFAMPSTGEPFGLVYLEAMAMALPVVALDSGGTPEVVEHGVTGLLSTPGDLDRLADHLSALLRDPQLRAQMGEQGRRRVRERFTVQRMARDVEDVYRRITDQDDRHDGEPSMDEEATRDDDHVRG